jgi:hypothetical protein
VLDCKTKARKIRTRCGAFRAFVVSRFARLGLP